MTGKAAQMREAWTTALELGGLAAITAGAGLVYLPAGFIVGGVCVVVVGVLIGNGAGE